MSIIPAGFHEYGMTNASNFIGAFPRQQPPTGEKRGHLFIGMTPTLKTVSNLSLGFLKYGMTSASNVGVFSLGVISINICPPFVTFWGCWQGEGPT